MDLKKEHKYKRFLKSQLFWKKLTIVFNVNLRNNSIIVKKKKTTENRKHKEKKTRNKKMLFISMEDKDI